VPGDGTRQRFPASGRSAAYAAEVLLPALPSNQVYWTQPIILDGAGGERFGPARPVPFEQVLVLERIPARLRFEAPTRPTERTLHLTSNSTVTIFKEQESMAVSQKVDGHMLETLKVDTRGLGTGITLALAPPRFTREVGGQKFEAPAAIGTYLSMFSPSFLVDANNRARERGNRSFAAVPPPHREAVEQLFEAVCNTWEVTTLPLPNRLVRPQESWPARVPMLVLVEGKREVRFLHVTCTYEGSRTANGRTEAFVRLEGVVRGRDAHAENVLGKVAGHALVDVEKGFLTQIKTVISCEVDSGNAGVRVLVTDESVVDRTEGNPRNIKVGGGRP
jgi:hypothetical protein